MYSSPSKAATVRAAGDSQMRHVLYQLAQQGVTPLPGWHPASRRVRRVLDRLLPFSGLEGEAWEVFVIPTAEQNAFVLPGGKVFVHAGILEVAGGDAGLAAVLGHEIAHNVADHVGERMSAAVGTDVLLYGMMLVVGMVGFGPMLMHYFGGRLLEVAFGRPMSRVQEREADYIGLMMMSEACYDPREAVGFWERMMRRGGKEEPPEWLSTHPSNERRVEAMREWLPVAMEKRANSDCRTTASFAEGFRRALGRGVIVVY
ncbi:putative mitochondrial metalloendopeptidase oma1 protein [Podospora conica]|nr:putative mitochondrial metalloendopeptidase oma1 protein [Schizothecium conicum]